MTQNNALTEQEQQDLQRYGEVLKQYFDPEIRAYSPIGWRRTPKIKRQKTEQAVQEKEDLEQKLEIKHGGDIGEWLLEMNTSNLPGSRHYDSPYWFILPIRSGNKAKLDYLAQEVFPSLQLPEIVPNQQFIVRTTYIEAGW